MFKAWLWLEINRKVFFRTYDQDKKDCTHYSRYTLKHFSKDFLANFVSKISDLFQCTRYLPYNLKNHMKLV